MEFIPISANNSLAFLQCILAVAWTSPYSRCTIIMCESYESTCL